MGERTGNELWAKAYNGAPRPVVYHVANCEDAFCDFGNKEFTTWREARVAALKHYREVGHTTRAESTRTILFWGGE